MRKLAILESLDSMDHVQMEKVLEYIKEILQQEPMTDNRKFRKQAMEQIRLALRSEKSLKVRAWDLWNDIKRAPFGVWRVLLPVFSNKFIPGALDGYPQPRLFLRLRSGRPPKSNGFSSGKMTSPVEFFFDLLTFFSSFFLDFFPIAC